MESFRDTPHSKGISTGKWNSISETIFFNLNNESKDWNQKYKIDKAKEILYLIVNFQRWWNFFYYIFV
jgi:hypothetical protein